MNFIRNAIQQRAKIESLPAEEFKEEPKCEEKQQTSSIFGGFFDGSGEVSENETSSFGGFF